MYYRINTSLFLHYRKAEEMSTYLLDVIAENSATTPDGHVIWLGELHPQYKFPITWDRNGKWVSIRYYLNAKRDGAEGYHVSHTVTCGYKRYCIHPDCCVPRWTLRPGWEVA